MKNNKKKQKRYIAINYQAKHKGEIVHLLAWDKCPRCKGTGKLRKISKNIPDKGCDCIIVTKIPVSFIIRDSK